MALDHFIVNDHEREEIGPRVVIKNDLDSVCPIPFDCRCLSLNDTMTENFEGPLIVPSIHGIDKIDAQFSCVRVRILFFISLPFSRNLFFREAFNQSMMITLLILLTMLSILMKTLRSWGSFISMIILCLRVIP